jgi:hypothetical protein
MSADCAEVTRDALGNRSSTGFMVY